MFKIFTVILLISLFSFPAHAQEDKNDAVERVNTCQELGEKLAKCKPYKCQMTHPQADKFIVEHVIIGFKTDELLCNHTQTIPGNGIIDCQYPRAMRQLMAKQANGTKLSDSEAQIVSDTFEHYCIVVQ